MTEKLENTSNTSTKILSTIAIVLVVGIIALSLYIGFNRLTAPDTAVITEDFDDAYDGSTLIDPPSDMPDFSLTNQDGNLTSLNDFRGKFVLMTFGYTHCPDVCPLTLGEFRSIRESLGELAQNIEFVFISVDGKRDTPEVLKQYFETRKLDGFIGLTGAEADLHELGKDYGLFFEIGENTSKGGYLVNHTAGSFLLNPDGQWIMRYQFGALPSMIVDDLETFMTTN